VNRKQSFIVKHTGGAVAQLGERMTGSLIPPVFVARCNTCSLDFLQEVTAFFFSYQFAPILMVLDPLWTPFGHQFIIPPIPLFPLLLTRKVENKWK
jgi:hypothetical protein